MAISKKQAEIIHDLDEVATKERYSFGKFAKCLFHIHTPASYDYKLLNTYTAVKYKNLTDEEAFDIGVNRGLINPTIQDISMFNCSKYVSIKEKISYLLIANKLIQAEIEIAVLTDHNTIDGYEKLTTAIEELNKLYKPKIYPKIILGIEISCSDENLIVGIFDESKSNPKIIENINTWLLEYFMGNGKGTYLNSLQVMEKINELNGIAYIAHINTSKVFSQFTIDYRKKLFELPYFNFVGLSKLSQREQIEKQINNITKKKFNFILDEDSHDIDNLGEKFF